jgi:hypothetical protein
VGSSLLDLPVIVQSTAISSPLLAFILWFVYRLIDRLLTHRERMAQIDKDGQLPGKPGSGQHEGDQKSLSR